MSYRPWVQNCEPLHLARPNSAERFLVPLGEAVAIGHAGTATAIMGRARRYSSSGRGTMIRLTSKPARTSTSRLGCMIGREPAVYDRCS
jgi:hypothetical protein